MYIYIGNSRKMWFRKVTCETNLKFNQSNRWIPKMSDRHERWAIEMNDERWGMRDMKWGMSDRKWMMNDERWTMSDERWAK